MSPPRGTDPPYVVILAGGVGSRFWPASRPERPKQLLPLGGDSPLVVETMRRAQAITDLSHVRIVTGRHLLVPTRAALPRLREEHFLVEPIARGTGPALTWAAHHVWSADPEAVMVSLHADHVISPLEAFRETIGRAVAAARSDHRLYCVGIRPSRPETAYGYVEMGRELDGGGYEIERFVEKPDVETAERYLASGRFLWNTGLFVWRAADFLEEVGRWTPELHEGLEGLKRGDVEEFFQHARPVSVDVGVMERTDRGGLVEATFRWDDVGSWNALARTRPADPQGNVTVGRAELIDASDNVVWSEDGRVVLFRVRDLVVVHTDGRTFVTTRDAAPELKDMLSRMEEEAES